MVKKSKDSAPTSCFFRSPFLRRSFPESIFYGSNPFYSFRYFGRNFRFWVYGRDSARVSDQFRSQDFNRVFEHMEWSGEKEDWCLRDFISSTSFFRCPFLLRSCQCFLQSAGRYKKDGFYEKASYLLATILTRCKSRNGPLSMVPIP